MRALIAFLLLASTARAETMLLAEFKWSNYDPVTLPTEYILQSWGPKYGQFEWREEVTAWPHTSQAPPDLVARINDAFTLGTGVHL